jgi:lauroyl/myristoyl acyltransferase
VPFPAEGTRRERVTAYLAAQARAFERQVARAPEQWLSVFHPLWPDLERPAPERVTSDRAVSRRPERPR